MKEALSDRDLELSKSKSILDRTKDEKNICESVQSDLKESIERIRKQTKQAKESLENEISELRTQLKHRDNKLLAASDEISVLRDQSGGATKALSQEKKRLEEVEDNLQRAIAAGRQRETSLKSEIETKIEEISKSERKNAEMV